MPNVTIKDLSEMLGISTTTISLVLNNKHKRYKISDYTARRVLAKAKEMNYQPSGYALAVSGKATRTLGLIHPYVRVDNEIYTRCLMSLVRRIQATHHCLINLKGFEEEPHEPMEGYIERMIGKLVDGLFISIDVYDIPLDMMSELHEQGFPIVLVYFRKELRKMLKDRFHCFAVDRTPGLIEAARHIMATDAVKATFFGDIHGGNAEKADALESAFKESRVDFMRRNIKGYISWIPERREILWNWIRDIGKNEVVFFGSDYEARLALDMARSLGKRVPDELQIIGFNNDSISHNLSPHIATVEQPVSELAEKAVQLMTELLNSGKKKTETVLIPSRFIARETVKPV